MNGKLTYTDLETQVHELECCIKRGESIINLPDHMLGAAYDPQADKGGSGIDGRFRLIFERAGIGMAIVGLDGRIVDSNVALQKMVFYSGKELAAMAFTDITHPDDVQTDWKLAQELFTGKTDFYRIEKRYLRKDKQVLWGRLTASIVRDDQGKPQFGIGMIEDITDRKRSEADLKNSEIRFRNLAESLPETVYEMDENGSLTFVNRKAFDHFLYTQTDLEQGLSAFDMIAPEDRQRARENFKEIITGKDVGPSEYRALRKDATSFPAVFHTSSLAREGKKQRLQGFVVDITERKRAEEDLRRSEQQVRSKLESILSPEGDIEKLDLSDIIDIEALQSLMDDFYTLSQIPMSIIDLEGRVLVGIGWQDICTKFHRCRNCIESDLQLTAGIPPGESKLYKCKNNMWDIVTPLWVGGKHVGNIFCGQFFFEEDVLDDEFFRSQAKRCGFDEEAYISALKSVPRLSRESVDTGMAFFLKLSDMISKLSYGNVKFARSLAQREALMASLRESRQDLNRAQAVSKTGSWRMDVRKNQLLWSDETYRMFEIPKRTPLTYETFISAVHPDDREYVDLNWKAAIQGEPYDIEHRILAGDRIKWVREKAELELDSTGDLLGGFGTVQDITERKMAEEALRESEQRYRRLFEMESDAIFLIEKETGSILEANEAASTLYGYTRDELLTKRNTDMSAEPDQTRKSTQDSSIVVPIRYHKRKDGMVFPVEIKATHFKWQGRDVHIAAIRDITARIDAEKERSDMEKRLQRAQKMEAIGTLAGGIAHDFNNILFPIMGISEMLLEDLPPDSLVHENAQEIFKAGKRASELVKRILAFSRQTEHQMMPIRIQHVLHEVLKLARSTVPSNIEIVQDIQKGCGLVMADPTQVHQIAMNLITNAYHAVEQTGGRISIQLMELGSTREDADDSLKGRGRYAMLRVSDTGCGIDPAVMNRIFEPYFTTKQPGKGTGLGLSIVYGIVQEHRGEVRVHSRQGKGTTVTVYLPLVEKSEETISSGIEDDHIFGTESILLVDDEEPIARLEKQMLERLGYRVTTRTSSFEALEVFKAAPERFDLIVTDMMMPNMIGIQLARELKKISPDVPIIICTGFSEHINEKNREELGIDGYVMKPVIRSEIAKTIRKTLEFRKKRLSKKGMHE